MDCRLVFMNTNLYLAHDLKFQRYQIIFSISLLSSYYYFHHHSTYPVCLLLSLIFYNCIKIAQKCLISLPSNCYLSPRLQPKQTVASPRYRRRASPHGRNLWASRTCPPKWVGCWPRTPPTGCGRCCTPAPSTCTPAKEKNSTRMTSTGCSGGWMCLLFWGERDCAIGLACIPHYFFQMGLFLNRSPNS